MTKTPSLVQDCLGFTPGSGITLDRATNATFTVVELPIQGSQRTYTIELFDELDPTKTKAFELTLSLKCKTHSKLEFAQKYVEVIYEDGDPIDTNEIALPALIGTNAPFSAASGTSSRILSLVSRDLPLKSPAMTLGASPGARLASSFTHADPAPRDLAAWAQDPGKALSKQVARRIKWRRENSLLACMGPRSFGCH